jgi:GDPmannose 4,6-dehydratase
MEGIRMQGRSALIVGITGQDGAYLAEFLLSRGYVVHGVRPYAAVEDLSRVAHLVGRPGFILHHGDLIDGGGMAALLARVRPGEIYNLGAMSHVAVSFDSPEATAQVNALGPVRILEAIRVLGLEKVTRFYQASSSEMFGNAPAPQNEQTPFQPCSPYAAAKLYAYWMVRTYRDAYGLFASNGILFNHESPQRGDHFVTRKIVRHVAARVRGENSAPLALGNLDARRDWGHARDYVRGMWMILNHDRADDFVLATGQSHSVRDFTTLAFQAAGRPIQWVGRGLEEKAVCVRTGVVCVVVDPALMRPLDVNVLRGDASKAREVLGWVPEFDFSALVADMVHVELDSGKVDYDRAA